MTDPAPAQVLPPKRRLPWLLAVLAAFGLGYLFGAVGGPKGIAREVLPEHVLEELRGDPLGNRRRAADFAALEGKRVWVILAIGQSNAANRGWVPAEGGPGVYSFYKGRLYEAQDPLRGADGDRGSPWTRLGPMIRDAGLADAVVFVPAAISGSGVLEWSNEGRGARRLRRTLDALHESPLEVSHVFWLQGQADTVRQTPQAEYEAALRRLLADLRAQGVEAPVYVARASFQYGYHSLEVRAGQLAVINAEPGVLAGPDMDTLDLRWRYDGAHFTGEGLQRHAELWLDALRAADEVTTPGAPPSGRPRDP